VATIGGGSFEKKENTTYNIKTIGTASHLNIIIQIRERIRRLYFKVFFRKE
jgi:hypothetical protein